MDFKYERLPLFCHFCGFMGHDIKHCAEYFARSKNASEVACQYGEWLKPSGGRPRSPGKGSSSTPKQPASAVRTEVQVGNEGWERSAADGENTKDNPTEATIDVSGRSVDSGKIPDCTKKESVTDEIMMESYGPLSLVTDSAVLNSRGEGVLHGQDIKHVGVVSTTSVADHVGTNDQNGLQELKQKPTWTRLVRMECRPNMDRKEASPHKLGKRGLTDIDAEAENATEVKGGKRGRYQENAHSGETAGVQEHPYRAQ